MHAITSGIKELHACGWIHKEIKASNIFVGMKLDGPFNPKIKIGDYTRARTMLWAPDFGRLLKYCKHCRMDRQLRILLQWMCTILGWCATRSLRAKFLSKAILCSTSIWFCQAKDQTFFTMCRLTWGIYCIAVDVTILLSGSDGLRFKISYLSIFWHSFISDFEK
jgi:serine/threonine protein kinase